MLYKYSYVTMTTELPFTLADLIFSFEMSDVIEISLNDKNLYIPSTLIHTYF